MLTLKVSFVEIFGLEDLLTGGKKKSEALI